MGWLFLRKEEVLKIHAQVIALFGGSEGVRDEAALASALMAAENRGHYENSDLATCAATYAYHLTQAHAFVDGNKRAAAATAEVFLEINGARLSATNQQIVDLFMGMAVGNVSRDEAAHLFQDWIDNPT